MSEGLTVETIIKNALGEIVSNDISNPIKSKAEKFPVSIKLVNQKHGTPNGLIYILLYLS
jgi:hypothetical protein